MTASATCTGGRTLIGGGAEIVATPDTGRAYLERSYPSVTGVNGVWTARGAAENLGGLTSFTVTAFAICQ